MTDSPEVEGEPVIRDRRRLDPQTGELREDDAVVGDTPDGGAADPSEEAAASDETAAAKAEALDLADQLARSKADVYNLDQRFNAFVKRSRAEVVEARGRGHQDVVEALVGVLDDIDLARQHEELTGPFASIAEKLEGVLTGSFAMERFGAAGEEFDPSIHEALMHATDVDAKTETVQQVLQPGYKVGDKVIRPARVSVVGPE
ncbi:MAG: nucleotide exchange factor GrpE [Beutenbergiaceae bacterium]